MAEPDEDSLGTRALACAVVPVAQLTAAERAELYRLMSSHFDQVDEGQFFRDLDEKPSLVLVREAGKLRGFSTIMLIETIVAGRRIGAVFAGDTVIEPACWGHPAWVYAWARHGFAVAQQARCDAVYLLLLTSTVRTYRFMPAFFREYAPRPDRETALEIQADLDALVRLKFPAEYDAAAGVVVLQRPTPVRPERSDLAAAEVDDEHGKLLFAQNPGYEQGNFLACLAEFTWENLTPLGSRVVSDG